MSSDNDEWYSSYVMGISREIIFVVIIEKGITAVARGTKMELGEFYEVKIVPNHMAAASMSAKHLVTQFKPMSPLASVRIEHDTRGASHVYLTTTARFDKYVSWSTLKCARWTNDTFGHFIDMQGIVKENGNRLATFEFKSKGSPAERSKSIFVPTRLIEYVDPIPQVEEPLHVPQSLKVHGQTQTIKGLVGSESVHRDSRYVWSPSRPEKDYLVHERFFPPYDEMMGRWIEFTVDDREQVMESVRIISDCFTTRIECGFPEVMTEIQYDGQHSEGFGMYWNDTFRWICDLHHEIKNAEKDAWYRCWIIHFKREGVKSQWKISSRQLTPKCISDQRPRSVSPRRDSPSRNDGSSERYLSPPRSQSNRNESTAPHNSQRDRNLSPPRNSAHCSRKESPHRYNTQSIRSESPQRYNPRHSQNQSPPRNRAQNARMQSPSRYSAPNRSAGNSSHRSRTPSPVSRPPSRAPSTDDDIPVPTIPSRTFSPVEDVSPAKRREVKYAESDFSGISSPARSLAGNETSHKANVALSESRDSFSVVGEASDNSSHGMPQTSNVARDIKKMKNKIARIQDLVTFFTEDKDIRQAMRMLDMEHYDELMELARQSE